jgi:N4-gp56 family major capsid protein
LTIQFTREEKFTVSTTPTQLTQGIAPDAAGLTLNQFTAVAEQYGFVVRLSDLAELTAKHPIVEKTIYLLGLHAAETYDQLVFNVLDAATTTYRPNGRTVDTAVLASDLIGYNDLIELEAQLQTKGARPFGDGDYVGIFAPQVYASLLKDPDFKAAAQFKAPERIWKGEVQELGGIRIVRSNSPAFAFASQATSGFTNRLYSSFIIAQFAYQVSDLQNLRVYVVAPGGQSDVLQQNRKIGWKFAFKAIITNQDWLRRVRSSGQDSTNN